MRNPRFGASVGARVLGALCAFTVVTSGCGPEQQKEGAPEKVDSAQAPVVYGTDNRTDVYAHADATLRARAQQATVALMNASDYNATDPNNVTFNGANLQSSYSLCSTERFLSDPTPAFCSGTLIDDDLVLTAGHCVTSQSACTSTRFVFKFYRTAANTLETVTTQDIFSCQTLVARQQATVNGRNLDYAVIRLDRSAAPRFTPAPVRAGSAAMPVGANVAVIGSGSGIPFKIDAGGSVRDARASTLDYFIASTDTFGGNSGSGVYETSGYTVAGILVRGETDYVSNGSCNIVNVCTESGCRGEDITYVRPAIDAYCAVATSSRLCTGTPPPTGNTFAYSASGTNSAQQNTSNKVIALTAGQKLTLGTCGVTGSAFTGDTYLRLFGPGGTEVVGNDDACGGRGSSVEYTVPATGAGNYELRAGCYSSGSCTGTVAWTITGGTTPPATGGTFAFNVTNTNSAQQNTQNQDITAAVGQVITVGTCDMTGASATGDTYIRLFGPGGVQAAVNDDSCSLSSKLTYTVPAGGAGTYQARVGCYSSNSCSGTAAWTVQ
ncbi:serine protease [Myxococcaceae bacterium GXIMD 01537]